MCQACTELPYQVNDVIEIDQVNEPEMNKSYGLKPLMRGVILHHNLYYEHIAEYWVLDPTKIPEGFQVISEKLIQASYREQLKQYWDTTHLVLVWSNNQATSALILRDDKYLRFHVTEHKIAPKLR